MINFLKELCGMYRDVYKNCTINVFKNSGISKVNKIRLLYKADK